VKHNVTILDAVNDKALFAPWFVGKKRQSFENWFTFLTVLFALGPLSPQQLAVFTECTGRSVPPATPVNEVWLQIGRRGGKSFILALIAVYLSCFREYRHLLAPGERGTVVIIAQDRKAARAIFRFVKGLLHGVPMLRRMIERETADTFDLNNRVSIEIHVASFRSSRGYSIVAALCDEIAFWRSEESANPDRDILRSLRPGLATTNGMLLCASSPYAQRGEMWNAHRRHYAKDDSDVLYWRAPTKYMNPLIPQRVIDKAYEEDAASASAEFGAEFRNDADDFISRAVVDAHTVVGRTELPYIQGVHYTAFIDASGGSGKDSMTLGISHTEGDKVITDAARERKPPFSPEDCVKQFSDVIKSYGLTTATADNFAGGWVRERFAVHGVDVTKASMTKSVIYLAFLPIINSHRVELFDLPRFASQLCGLQRFTSRGGHEVVDHIQGHNFHDDLANAVCGACVYAAQRAAQTISLVAFDVMTGQVIGGGRPSPARQAQQLAYSPTAASLCNLQEQQRQLVRRREGLVQQSGSDVPLKLSVLDAEAARVEAAIKVEQANIEAEIKVANRPKENREPNATDLFFASGAAVAWEPPGGFTRRQRF
jgi:hypothetical protein